MEKGLVLKSTGSWYSVKTQDGKILNCKIKGKLRTFGIRSTNPVAVGDRVMLEISGDGTAMITDIDTRVNYLIRKASNLSKESHIMAANIDQAVLVITLAFPETAPEFIDRFLAASQAYRIPVTLIINKTDLYMDTLSGLIKEMRETYEPIGYPIIETSVVTARNIDSFRSMIKGKTSVLAGNSGVGKSSLLNAVYPGLNLKTGDISNYHMKGKHTTTFAEMVELPDGGYIIDTPGIKGFGMVHMDREEIYHFFPEIFRYAAGCQFHNCLHLDEPKCAVKKAVEEGQINSSRYLSYCSIMEDENNKYR